MSYGKVYFSRNKTGVKLSFTKIRLNRAIDNLNVCQLCENFTLVQFIIVKYPKSVKGRIEDEIKKKKINRDLYDLTNVDIQKLCAKYKQNLNNDSDYEESDSESEEESDSEFEEESDSEFEEESDSEYEEESDSESDNSSVNKSCEIDDSIIESLINIKI